MGEAPVIIYTYTAYCAEGYKDGRRVMTEVKRVVAASSYERAADLGCLSVAAPGRAVILYELKPWRAAP